MHLNYLVSRTSIQSTKNLPGFLYPEFQDKGCTIYGYLEWLMA